MLLKIIGSDTLTLGRKYLGAWHGQLRLKLTLISNVVLNFNDTTLPTRFIKVNFTQSFFGKEDVDLREKLSEEISGIANRCMAAYRRLVAIGRFVQPQTGIELERKVMAESDLYTAFINDAFVIDPNGMVECGKVKTKFEDWCRQRGRFDVLRSASTGSLLTRRLKGVAGLEGLSIYRPHGGARQYVGLRVKKKEERRSSEPLEPL
jgi:putative DNA primase/helicase